MRRGWKAIRIAFLLAGVLLAATAARADKIVLKNGRKIVAYNVVEDGDKVRYETTAGQLALPKSIVDHIERGGLLPVMGSPAEAAANLIMAQFTTERSTGNTSRALRQRQAEAARMPTNARRWRTTRHPSLNFRGGTWSTRLAMRRRRLPISQGTR